MGWTRNDLEERSLDDGSEEGSSRDDLDHLVREGDGVGGGCSRFENGGEDEGRSWRRREERRGRSADELELSRIAGRGRKVDAHLGKRARYPFPSQ